jgi:hypothetical protein
MLSMVGGNILIDGVRRLREFVNIEMCRLSPLEMLLRLRFAYVYL